MSHRDIFQAPHQTIAVVLAGGRGKRLLDLTSNLAKPGLDFGGKYRIIDFTLSNCVNSTIRKVVVLTQYNSHRLLEHLQFGWTFLSGKLDEFVHVLPAQQWLGGENWYCGTADAVFQNIDDIASHAPENVLILAGDHIYKMDYRPFLEDHLNQDADLSVACLEVPRQSATRLGVVEVDATDRIVGFQEKPEEPLGLPGHPDLAFASMGIYLFKAKFLFEALARDAADPHSTHDFGRDLIPSLLGSARVFAHRFTKSHIPNLDRPPYWRDVGTVDSFWEANLDLTSISPALNLYDTTWPIFTHQEQLPAAKFVHHDSHRNGVAISSLVSGGCIVSGARVEDSLLFSKVRVHSRANLHQAVVLPGADIGEGVHLRKVVVDRDCRVPAGMVVGENPEEDALRFHRTASGVTLIAQHMLDSLRG